MENSHYKIDFVTSNDSQLLDAYSATVTGVVKNVASAVVHIRVMKKVQEPRSGKSSEQPAYEPFPYFPGMFSWPIHTSEALSSFPT